MRLHAVFSSGSDSRAFFRRRYFRAPVVSLLETSFVNSFIALRVFLVEILLSVATELRYLLDQSGGAMVRRSTSLHWEAELVTLRGEA